MPKVTIGTEPKVEVKRTERVEVTQEIVRVPVESESRPGEFHYVSISMTCSCESWRYRSRCRHIHELLDQFAPRPKKLGGQ